MNVTLGYTILVLLTNNMTRNTVVTRYLKTNNRSLKCFP